MTFLLDTDHVTLDQHGHPAVRSRVQSAGPAQVFISIITGEDCLCERTCLIYIPTA